MKFFYRFTIFVVHAFFKIFYRFKVYGKEHYFKGPAIIAANHVSYFDPPILAVAWPEEIHFLAKEPLFGVPILGTIIKNLNTHPLKGAGSDAGVFKVICSLLLNGKKVILFPEGKRSDDNSLSQIKPGIGLLMTKTKCSIVPVYIFGAYEVWPRFRKFPKFFKTMGCIFGSRIEYVSYENLDKREAQAAIANKLTESIQALKQWYENGAIGTPP